jgi:hypothetical protein
MAPAGRVIPPKPRRPLRKWRALVFPAYPDRMIGYNSKSGSYHVPPEDAKHRPKGQAYKFGRAIQGAHEALQLPSGRWVVARVTWLPFGGGREETVLPGEFSSEGEAEQAVRAMMKEESHALIGRPPSVGKGPGVWKELEGDRDGMEQEPADR